MIDKKKVLQRASRGNSLPEYPLLNLYTLLCIIVQSLGQAFVVKLFLWLRPVPQLMMGLYVRAKNSRRKHLVPELVGWSLLIACAAQITWVFGNNLAIYSCIMSLAYLLQITALSVGDRIRGISSEFLWARRAAYLLILASLGLGLWHLHHKMHYPLMLWTYAAMTMVKLGISLHRYCISAGSSFSFVATGCLLSVIGEGAQLLVQLREFTQLAGGVGRLCSGIGSYLLMHGSLHQSNLQQQISQINNLVKRSH